MIRKANSLNNIEYDNLISTMPFPMLLKKCHVDYPKDIFTCNKVLVFNLGFDLKGNDQINNWIYIPNKEFVFYRIITFLVEKGCLYMWKLGFRKKKN